MKNTIAESRNVDSTMTIDLGYIVDKRDIQIVLPSFPEEKTIGAYLEYDGQDLSGGHEPLVVEQIEANVKYKISGEIISDYDWNLVPYDKVSRIHANAISDTFNEHIFTFTKVRPLEEGIETTLKSTGGSLIYPCTTSDNVKFRNTQSLTEVINELKNNMQKIHYSTVEPTAEDGKDGDLWIIYKE